MPNHAPAKTARVVVGVDTHRDEHMAVAIDQLGVRLGRCYIAIMSVMRFPALGLIGSASRATKCPQMLHCHSPRNIPTEISWLLTDDAGRLDIETAIQGLRRDQTKRIGWGDETGLSQCRAFSIPVVAGGMPLD